MRASSLQRANSSSAHAQRLATQDVPVRTRERQRVASFEHGGARRAQRNEAAERQQHVGAPLLGDARQRALFPGELA